VGAVALVAAVRGALPREERTVAENVERLLHARGSARDRAAFDLVAQVLAARRSGPDGAGLALDAPLLEALREAAATPHPLRSPADVPLHLALAVLLADAGDEEGLRRLVDAARLDPALDPRGEHRAYAISLLGNLGDALPASLRHEAARALVDHLDGEDAFLRSLSAAALGSLPAPETRPALHALLDASALEVRLNAALSLARLGYDAGAAVLREAVTPAPYRAERAAHPERWAHPVRIEDARRRALEALARLGQGPDRAELERLAAADEDAGVRELAGRLLNGERSRDGDDLPPLPSEPILEATGAGASGEDEGGA
jgi:HEAT repeat protein